MFQRFLSIPVPAVCLFAAIVIYGLFGSPTPDNPGIVEIIIGILLMAAASLGLLKRFRDLDMGEPLFLRLLHITFITGLILPFAVGVYNGNDLSLMMRDIFSFLFLCLPLFLVRTLGKHEKAALLLPYFMGFAGIAFAVRTLLPAFNIWIAGGELLYLSNSPLVLFAAIASTAIIWRALSNFTLRQMPICIAGGGVIFVIMAAMLLDVQRATIAAIGISLTVLWLDTLINNPRRIVLPTIVLIAAMIFITPWLSDAAGAIYKKTTEVGLNMRLQEAGAVLDAISADPLSFFLGAGWGGVFSSPAVGGLSVNYTHSLLTLMLLKGGIVLGALTILFSSAVLYEIILIFQRDRGKALSVFWPFIIPLFLYASHKSFDFGLLVLLIGVWRKRPLPLRAAA